MSRQNYRRLVIVLVITGLLCPFEVSVVPSWRVRVIDERGIAYPGKEVRQFWKNYSLELDVGLHSEYRPTDKNGYVEFPERTIYTNLLIGILMPLIVVALSPVHGSTGAAAYVQVSGPQGYKTLEYVPGKPLPNLIILPDDGGEP